MKAVYCLNSYSITDLLSFLVAERGESIRFVAGYQPTLRTKGQEFEVEGPVVGEETMEELLRTVASTRQMIDFRQRGMIDIVHSFKDFQFLVRAVRAFGDFRFELHALGA
jgi:Tfp pilus assembly pilus retraction ATPase PilT